MKDETLAEFFCRTVIEAEKLTHQTLCESIKKAVQLSGCQVRFGILMISDFNGRPLNQLSAQELRQVDKWVRSWEALMDDPKIVRLGQNQNR